MHAGICGNSTEHAEPGGLTRTCSKSRHLEDSLRLRVLVDHWCTLHIQAQETDEWRFPFFLLKKLMNGGFHTAVFTCPP